MYNLPSFCCICFSNQTDLKQINNKENDDNQIINKLKFCSFDTEWDISDFPIFICCKCKHILDLACDFKNMCLKSNRILRGYVSQLKNTSNSVENIRIELLSMFNTEKTDNLPVKQSENKLEMSAINIKVKEENNDDFLHPKKEINCYEIKNEFININTASCSNNSETLEPFTFEIKPSGTHQCTLCHKSFSRESVLTRHMLIHSGERPHNCTICNKNFTHKFNLKQHMLIHSGHKTHHCTVCDKGFIKKSDLDRHMLTHFGERIHHCSLCSKSFVRKENLNQHILTHTGQKPHHCTQCTKSFLRKSDLNRHILLCVNKRN